VARPGRCRLFDHGGILLSNLIHPVHCEIDLGLARGLFARCLGNVQHERLDAREVSHSTAPGISDLDDEIHPNLYGVGGFADQTLDLLGGIGRARTS
jgi:hypothetical protein